MRYKYVLVQVYTKNFNTTVPTLWEPDQGTCWISMTLFTRHSVVLKPAYLAQCPGLSDRPSLAITKDIYDLVYTTLYGVKTPVFGPVFRTIGSTISSSVALYGVETSVFGTMSRTMIDHYSMVWKPCIWRSVQDYQIDHLPPVLSHHQGLPQPRSHALVRPTIC
jgi:hypothetical protein